MGEAIRDENVGIEQMATADQIQQLFQLFDKTCAERHAFGAKKYGELDYLDNEVAKMMLEELADVANYARYAFVKVCILIGLLEKMREEAKAESEPGPVNSAFFQPHLLAEDKEK